jgi:hypothetical protein
MYGEYVLLIERLIKTGEEEDYLEIPVAVHYRYVPGKPGCQYMSNGDPGYPDDPPELDIMRVEDQDGNAYLLTDDEEDRLLDLIEELED